MGDPQIAMVPPRSALARFKSQVAQMEVKRDRHLPLWRDVQDFVVPYAADVNQRGYVLEDAASAILDDTILFCRTTLASGLYWGLTNPARLWSQWMLSDAALMELAAVKEFLHVTNSRRMTILAQSNFYRAMAWVYGEWPAFGTAAILIEEDEADVVRYVPWGIGSYSIAQDSRGDVNAVSRRFPMTLRQIVERFASEQTARGTQVLMDRLPERLRQAVKSGTMWEHDYWIRQLICPNDWYRADSDSPSEYAYASVFWEESASETDANEGLLAREGYREWPMMVFRWETVAGDPWGTDSPGILTLPSNKSSQQMESDKLFGIEKLVKPPIVGPSDMGALNMLPAGRNAIAGLTRPGMVAPLHTVEPVGITVIRESQGELREQMMAQWFTRLMLSFTANQDQARQKTAREVEEVSQEKYLVLARVVEAAGRTLKAGSEREFAIMERRGLLPAIPQELEGQNLDIEFTSMFASAQRALGLNELRSFGGYVVEIANASGNPANLDKLDMDQLFDEIGLRGSLPPRVIRSDADVAKIRRTRAEAQAQERQVAMAEQESQTAKNLAQAPVDDGNALGRVLNAQQGTPL